MIEQVILVDNQDRPLGVMPKLEVHQKGLLHRAFSVFIFNSNGELLLQQRSHKKYHSAGLWSNTCCSHPMPGESVSGAASRRLKEEMGIKAELIPVFSFIYHADLESGLIEYEFDHVLFGISNELPAINKTEVQDYKLIALDALALDISKSPDTYTAWLKECMDKVIIHYNKLFPTVNLEI